MLIMSEVRAWLDKQPPGTRTTPRVVARALGSIGRLVHTDSLDEFDIRRALDKAGWVPMKIWVCQQCGTTSVRPSKCAECGAPEPHMDLEWVKPRPLADEAVADLRKAKVELAEGMLVLTTREGSHPVLGHKVKLPAGTSFRIDQDPDGFLADMIAEGRCTQDDPCYPDLRDRPTFLLVCDEAERLGIEVLFLQDFPSRGTIYPMALDLLRTLVWWQADRQPALFAALARKLAETPTSE